MCGEEPIELHPAEAALAGAQKPYSHGPLALDAHPRGQRVSRAREVELEPAQELCQLVVRLVAPSTLVARRQSPRSSKQRCARRVE